MSNQNIDRNSFRIPNLPMGQIVDEKGMPTDDELTFRQALIGLLQQFFGEEGMLMPQQTAADILTIQNNTQATPGATPGTDHTCAPGTFLYDTTNNSVVVSELVGGLPVFKQLAVFDNTTLYPTAGAILGYGLVTYNGTQYKAALYAL